MGDEVKAVDSGTADPTALLRELTNAVAVRVHTLARTATDVSSRDQLQASRTARLAAAYHQGAAPVVWAWHREHSGGPVELLAAGTSVTPPRTESTSLKSGVLWGRLTSQAAWTPILARPDGLLSAGQRSSAGPSGEVAAAETQLEHALSEFIAPFTMLVVAEPLTYDVVDQCIRAMDTRAVAEGRRRDSRPDDEVAHRRWSERVAELRLAQTQGAWLLRMLVGAADRPAAAGLAGIVAAGLDVAELGYVLAPTNRTSDLSAAMAAALPHAYATDHERDWKLPDPAAGIVPSQVVAAVTRPPLIELPGVRLTDVPTFDVNPEHLHASRLDTGGIDGLHVRLGEILDTQLLPAGPFTVTGSSLNRHTFVAGATGAGKSQTVRSLLESAAKEGVPWLVIEPAKAEYGRMADRLPTHEVVVARPGDPHQVAAGIDPLRPAPGFPLQTHLDLVRGLFLAAFDADEPFPQVLAAALTRAYQHQGWDIALGEPVHVNHQPRYPTLADLEQAALEVIEEIGYGREIADNVRGFVGVRLASLRLGTTGLFFEGGQPLDIAKLLTRNVVLEIQDVGDDRDRAFLIGVVLIALTEHLRVAERRGEVASGELRHLTVIEEAHRLLRRTESRGAAAEAVEMFAAMLAEVRAYGEGLIIAEQIPAKLIPDVIKNSAVKILHRLPAEDDRSAVGATMNLSDEQSAYLVTLDPGTAAVFSDGMDRPVLARMPDGTKIETERAKVPAGPDDIVQQVSGRCGADFGLGNISLGARVRGRRLIETNPLLHWWAELSVVRLLVGIRPHSLGHEFLEELEQIDAETLLAGLAYGIDEAVAVRSSRINDSVSPAALATRAFTQQVAALDDPRNAEGHSELEWTATTHRWSPIVAELRVRLHRNERPNEPHPTTSLWYERYGMRVLGMTLRDQLDYAEGRRRATYKEPVASEVVFGIQERSKLEQAADCARDEPGWPAIVSTHVSTLGFDWAQHYLVRPPRALR